MNPHKARPAQSLISHVQATLHLLSVMTSDHRFEEALQDAQQTKEVRNMCDVLDRVENRGILKGRQEGILKGRQEGILKGRQEGILKGRQEGRQEGRFSMLVELVRKGLLSADQAAAEARMSVADFLQKATAASL